jgi:hypothetical protein
VSFSPVSSFCWFQPPSSGSLLNTLGSSSPSIPASIPSFSSFAALPPDESSIAAEATSAASNAPALIGSGTLGALISMQSDPQSTNTAAARDPASDATGSAVAPSPPADPPLADEASPAVHADGGAPVAVASPPPAVISVAANAPAVADAPNAGPVTNTSSGALVAAGGSPGFAQQIDGWWLQLLNS